jgi:hypothetical protein
MEDLGDCVRKRCPAAPLQTRALSLVAAAIYDATIAAWDSKYGYNRQHPADMDSSVSTVVTASASPSYPSEHAVTAAAAGANAFGYPTFGSIARTNPPKRSAQWRRSFPEVAT